MFSLILKITGGQFVHEEENLLLALG